MSTDEHQEVIDETEAPGPRDLRRTIDANQIVGANFRLARELKGWTQEVTAAKLAPYLGQTLPKASISAIERGLDRDRRRVFNAQELVAFSLGFDLPIWWFFLPLVGSDTVRLENTGERASNLLMLLLGRDDQMEELAERVRELRERSNRTAVDELLEGFVGAKSWQHLEATRLLAIQELAYREASTIESLIAGLRDVVAKFDGVFAKVGPRDVETAAFMEWKPTQVYRKTSEVLLGKTLFHKAFNGEDDFRRHRLDLLLSREDLPLEDWIDTEDRELMSRVAAVFDRIEEQLRDKELPPPPDHVPDTE